MAGDETIQNLLQDMLKKTLAKGASAADAVHVKSHSLAVSQRLGNPEKMERSESSDIGLRAFFGKRQAIVSSSDTSPDAIMELVDRVISMAKVVPEDPYCGIAEKDQLVTKIIKD